MKILLTGATGYIGSHLAEAICGKHEIYGLCRRKPEGKPPYEPVLCDLTEDGFEKTLPRGVDAICHFAQSRHYRHFPEKAGDMFNVSLRSLFPLLEYARETGVKKFIYASSGGFGDMEGKSFVEARPQEPLNFYLATKYASELLIESYAQLMTVIILRPHFVYGPHQTDRVIPNLINAVKNEKPIYLSGEDGNVFNPIYIDDAVALLERTLDLDSYYRLNIAGPENVTIRDLSRIISRELIRRPQFARVESPVLDLTADISRTVEVLGYSPGVKPAQGVREVIAAAGARQDG